MQWWNSFVAWLGSSDGWRILSGAIIPFLAIVIAGWVAAGIGRGSTRRLLDQANREASAAAVAALISAGRRSSVWNTLSEEERRHAEFLANEADIRVRLLTLPGSATVANWAEHELAGMRKNSATFSFQAEQSLVDFRDRIVLWRERPNRAKKLFQDDLDSWRNSAASADQDLRTQQQAWTEQQAGDSQVVHPDPPAPRIRPAQVSQPQTDAPAPAAAPVGAAVGVSAAAAGAAPIPTSAPAPAATPTPAPTPPSTWAGAGHGEAEPARPALVEPEPLRPEPVLYSGGQVVHPAGDESETGAVDRLEPDPNAYPAPLPVHRAREQANPPAAEEF